MAMLGVPLALSLAVAAAAEAVVSRPRASGAQVLWWLGVLGLSSVALLGVQPLARRALPAGHADTTASALRRPALVLVAAASVVTVTAWRPWVPATSVSRALGAVGAGAGTPPSGGTRGTRGSAGGGASAPGSPDPGAGTVPPPAETSPATGSGPGDGAEGATASPAARSAPSTAAAAPATTTEAPPAPPAGVAGTGACTVIGLLDPEIVLSWTDSRSSGVTGYEVLRRAGGGPSFTLVASLPVGAVSYADTAPLRLGSTYWYEIGALSPGGTALSAAVEVTTPVACL